MMSYNTAVIGGGAAGITAAISAKRSGESVVICDKIGILGKKILASGNGRCNLSNVRIDASCYNSASQTLVESIFAKFGKEHIENFFRLLGLKTYSDSGRIFPITNQASSVLKVLELELERLAVPVELNFDIVDISHSDNGFLLKSKSDKKISCSKLILAGGGRSYPALGCDGSCYRLSEGLGHTIIEPVPAAVPLVVKDALCHELQGTKIFAHARSVIDGRPASEVSGDLIFTKYGLSGTAILDVSEEISIAINRLHKKDVSVSIDMVPFMEEGALVSSLSERIAKNIACEYLLAGILPNKFGAALRDLLRTKDPSGIAGALKRRMFRITGTRGWNECEFTAGGVDTAEVAEGTLESKIMRGLYFAGEILDVNGARGGYNLAWAWASGFIAGGVR